MQSGGSSASQQSYGILQESQLLPLLRDFSDNPTRNNLTTSTPW
jgi:hypothetical protein